MNRVDDRWAQSDVPVLYRVIYVARQKMSFFSYNDQEFAQYLLKVLERGRAFGRHLKITVTERRLDVKALFDLLQILVMLTEKYFRF